MSSSTLASTFTANVSTLWGYILSIFSPAVELTIGLVALGVVFSLIAYGVYRVFRHNR